MVSETSFGYQCKLISYIRLFLQKIFSHNQPWKYFLQQIIIRKSLIAYKNKIQIASHMPISDGERQIKG